jgi:hypothetical protein
MDDLTYQHLPYGERIIAFSFNTTFKGISYLVAVHDSYPLFEARFSL